MRYHRILGLAAFAAPTTTYAEPTLSVTVTDGPTECADNEKVKSGDYVNMHYTGTIDESSETGEKGKKFDSSVDRGETFDAQIGVGQVIKGWDEGIAGLCKGAKATLIIPPDMGYGDHGAVGAIPGGATLNFAVEVIDITDSRLTPTQIPEDVYPEMTYTDLNQFLSVDILDMEETKLSVIVTDGPKECVDDDIVKSGDYISVHYTGTIDESSEKGEKGKKFDSSVDIGQTLDFPIGVGAVIRGWDKGIVGLCKGAKATLVIPPSMAYGTTGSGDDIPGFATLNFAVEVVNIRKGPPPGQKQSNMFDVINKDGNGYLSKEEVDAYFKEMGQADGAPPSLWEEEDKDNDGKITWEEFSGSKGDAPPSPSVPAPSNQGEL